MVKKFLLGVAVAGILTGAGFLGLGHSSSGDENSSEVAVGYQIFFMSDHDGIGR